MGICKDCKYFNACGNESRTEKCDGKELADLSSGIYEVTMRVVLREDAGEEAADEIKKWESHIDWLVDQDSYPEIDHFEDVQVKEVKDLYKERCKDCAYLIEGDNNERICDGGYGDEDAREIHLIPHENCALPHETQTVWCLYGYTTSAGVCEPELFANKQDAINQYNYYIGEYAAMPSANNKFKAIAKDGCWFELKEMEV